MKNKFGLVFPLLAVALHAEVKVLRNFTLIDGTGRAPVANSAMIIDNGRISWVGPVSQLKTPASAQVIDLSGKYVMPGLINLHGHLGAVIGVKQDASYETPDNVEKNLKKYASYGVTTVVSMGTDKDFVLQMRDKQRASGRPGETRIYSAGQGFVFKGGYGGLPGVTPEVATPQDVAPVIDKLAAEKVDLVKFWMDDHLGTKKKMPHEIGKAIIDDAHKKGLPVAAHIFYLEDAKAVVDYGINGLAHSVRDKPVDQALIDSMKRHGTWQMAATLAREAAIFTYARTPPFINDPFFDRGLSPDTIATLKSASFHQQMIKADPEYEEFHQFLKTAQENLKRLADAGVKYGFGTDSGPPTRFPGYAEHWELELMVQAGLTPMQVLTAATRNGAEFLKAKDLGTLEKSKWADLIVLDKNPLDDIRNSRTINAVYIAGNRVDK
ncbi:MAG TPA: amidohydrolase family protein [Bryobacteraceae bacterium]|jgi:imidazolonepropionase-like amidohydrolase|nr:amidohydrolase family protein [Bryobacteraceae bacterium]